jgi:hypothetical protein
VENITLTGKQHEKLLRAQAEAISLLGVPIFNPLTHGIKGEPLMVPAHEFNKVASAIQKIRAYVQITPKELLTRDSVTKLIDELIPPND